MLIPSHKNTNNGHIYNLHVISIGFYHRLPLHRCILMLKIYNDLNSIMYKLRLRLFNSTYNIRDLVDNSFIDFLYYFRVITLINIIYDVFLPPFTFCPQKFLVHRIRCELPSVFQFFVKYTVYLLLFDLPSPFRLV